MFLLRTMRPIAGNLGNFLDATPGCFLGHLRPGGICRLLLVLITRHPVPHSGPVRVLEFLHSPLAFLFSATAVLEFLAFSLLCPGLELAELLLRSRKLLSIPFFLLGLTLGSSPLRLPSHFLLGVHSI